MIPQSAIRNPQLKSRAFCSVVAFLGSLILHAALWFWFQETRLPYHPLPSYEELMLRKFKLERVEINPKWMEPKLQQPQHTSITPSPDKSSLAPVEEKRSFEKLLAEAPSAPTLPAGSPTIPQDKPIVSLDSEKTPSDAALRSSIESELEAASEQQLNQLSQPSAGRPVLSTPCAPVAPKAGSQDLALPSEPKVGPSQGAEEGGTNPIYTGTSRLEDFFGPGGLPVLEQKSEVIDSSNLVPQTLKETLKTDQQLELLNPFLDIELFTYEQTTRESEREGYFLIRISAKPKKQLPVIPKDVYFILDISSSIGKDRLDAYRQTVLTAISQLHPSDRFQVMAFRDKLINFREDWLQPSESLISDLDQWLEGLKPGGVTDFFDALKPLIKPSQKEKRAVLAVMMSDGIPTIGVLDSTQIISEFSKTNDGQIAIYTLSNGRNVNNFLLDFLAYCNQGRLQYSPEVELSGKKFVQTTQQLRDPLFLYPRFRFAGVDSEQIYPKNLPNLFQESPLLLFGRYIPGQNSQISLQIIGEGLEAPKELLVQLPIPSTPNGPEILPSTWARQKIYHLLGQMTRSRGSQHSVLEEVRELSEEYHVEVPYF